MSKAMVLLLRPADRMQPAFDTIPESAIALHQHMEYVCTTWLENTLFGL